MKYKDIQEIFKGVGNDKLFSNHIYLIAECLSFFALLAFDNIFSRLVFGIALIVFSVLSVTSSLNFYSVMQSDKSQQTEMLNLLDIRDRNFGFDLNMASFIKLFLLKWLNILGRSSVFIVVAIIMSALKLAAYLWVPFSLFLLAILYYWIMYGFANLLFYKNRNSDTKLSLYLKQSKNLTSTHLGDLIKAYSTMILPFIGACLLGFVLIVVGYIMFLGENYNFLVLLSEFICIVPFLIRFRYLFVYTFDKLYKEGHKDDDKNN